jgi:hypothetical protein
MAHHQNIAARLRITTITLEVLKFDEAIREKSPRGFLDAKLLELIQNRLDFLSTNEGKFRFSVVDLYHMALLMLAPANGVIAPLDENADGKLPTPTELYEKIPLYFRILLKELKEPEVFAKHLEFVCHKFVRNFFAYVDSTDPNAIQLVLVPKA